MGDAKDGGGGSSSAKASSSFESFGDRKRFTIELRPGETTIVSWKKLAKDANKADRPPSVAEVPPNAHPALESRLAPGQPAEDGVEEAPPASRFSAVIEKIERLYMGKHSSDEEDLNDVPPDDEYDTEDSFIDDAELDEYFQVDNSAIKHDGFFVNRGKLERINEPASLPNEQPKKRRRKDMEKFHSEGDDAHLANKHLKVGKKNAGNAMLSAGKYVTGITHVVALPSMHNDVMNLHKRTNSSIVRAKKRSGDTKMSVDPSPCKSLNGSSKQTEQRKIEPQKTPSKYEGNRIEDGGQTSDHSLQRSDNKSSYEHCKSQSGRVQTKADNIDQLRHWRGKDKSPEKVVPNVAEGKHPMQVVKALSLHKKEGSSVRPKSTMLEKAIRELEKMVAESKPPTTEVPEAEVKQRRLPREIKQKLAKVARLSATNGKFSNELLNRLMGILGHWIQLRTLKRNMKDMVNLGLSAKKEKDDRSQQMKTEIAELIRMRMPFIKKALEQQAGAGNDINEIGNEEEANKRKYSMDGVLEDKICDLYDLYVDGLEEDAGPQVRKLYAELAQMWPEGLMDNHGIKRAICRAKDRKRALYARQKDQEKIKRKKLLTPKSGEAVPAEGNSVAQPPHIQEKSASDPISHGPTALHKLGSDATAANASGQNPFNLSDGPKFNQLKEERVRSSLISNANETRTIDGLKKKGKRDSELEIGGAQNRKENNSASAQEEDRHKPRKQVHPVSQKPSLPFVVADTASVPIQNPSIPQAAMLNLNKPADA